MFKKLIVLPLITLMAISCSLREDLSDCGVLRLNFSYTWNKEMVDRLTDHVQDIHVYIFDAEGLLVRIVEATEADIARGYAEIEDLPGGDYTFTAWGGSSDDMIGGGFFEARMENAAAHRHSSIRIGETTLGEFYMMLEYDELSAVVQGDIAPRTAAFDDLFHAAVKSFKILPLTNQSVDFDFIRNTNVIKVTITGIEHLPHYDATTRADADELLQVWVAGKNGRYGWDNTIDDHARTVRYEPLQSSLTPSTMNVDIKTIHLNVDRHTGTDPIRLNVVNPVSGKSMIYPLNIVDAIQQVKGEEGDFLYPDQEAIDREYEFPIEISILSDLTTKIYIYDWEIVNLNPITDRD